MLRTRSLPGGDRASMFERDAPSGEVLSEASPGGEVELFGLLELGQVAIQTRPSGQQPEDAALVEDVHMVFPHHVINRGKPLAVTNQGWGQTGDPVSHASPSVG